MFDDETAAAKLQLLREIKKQDERREVSRGIATLAVIGLTAVLSIALLIMFWIDGDLYLTLPPM